MCALYTDSNLLDCFSFFSDYTVIHLEEGKDVIQFRWLLRILTFIINIVKLYWSSSLQMFFVGYSVIGANVHFFVDIEL